MVDVLSDWLQSEIRTGSILDVVKVHGELSRPDVASHHVTTRTRRCRAKCPVTGVGPGNEPCVRYRFVHQVDVECDALRGELINYLPEQRIARSMIVIAEALVTDVVQLRSAVIAIVI